jgi:hypothetical protein
LARKDLFVIELAKDVYLSTGVDPLHTKDRAQAKEFTKFKDAKPKLQEVRQQHKFFNAQIQRVA